MALNYLNKELKGPVTKPTGHEPMTTHVNKLLSGAMNYHGMPVPVDTRPTFSGEAGGPRAMVTKPTDHKPSFLSNIPLPFHTVVYNANARHVPDIETIGTEAARRRAEIRMQAARDAYVPVGAPIALLHQGNITSLQSRLVEKRNALRRSGLSQPEVDAMVADDVREIRAATIAMEEAQGGFGPARLRAERVLAPHMPEDTHKMKAEEYKAHLEKTVTDPTQVAELMRLYSAPHSATDESELSARINTGMAAAPASAYMKLSTRDWMDKFHPLAPKSVLSGPLNGPTATSGALIAPAAHVPSTGTAPFASAIAAAAVPGGAMAAAGAAARKRAEAKALSIAAVAGLKRSHADMAAPTARMIDFGETPDVAPAAPRTALDALMASYREEDLAGTSSRRLEAVARSALGEGSMSALPAPGIGSPPAPRSRGHIALEAASARIDSVNARAAEQAIGEARGNFVSLGAAGAEADAGGGGATYAMPPERVDLGAWIDSPSRQSRRSTAVMLVDWNKANPGLDFKTAPRHIKAAWAKRYNDALDLWREAPGAPQQPTPKRRRR